MPRLWPWYSMTSVLNDPWPCIEQLDMISYLILWHIWYWRFQKFLHSEFVCAISHLHTFGKCLSDMKSLKCSNRTHFCWPEKWHHIGRKSNKVYMFRYCLSQTRLLLTQHNQDLEVDFFSHAIWFLFVLQSIVEPFKILGLIHMTSKETTSK